MAGQSHLRPSDLHGLSRLGIDAVTGLTDLVEAMHHNIASKPGLLGKPPAGRTRGITGFVYRSIHGVTRLVGGSLDAVLGRLVPLFVERPSSPEREAILSALNGVLGDHLEAKGNPLAIRMRLRRAGQAPRMEKAALAAAFPNAGGRLLVLAHGLCMNDLQWQRQGHDHGAALESELGYSAVYLHYNSGRHISSNGREFAGLLEALLENWPVPVHELSILGHSMGGLLARSAWHYGTAAGHAWPRRLKKLVFLGTPHHGAPLERGGNWIDLLLGASPYS
ncbi:MAG: permease, partial [Rhodocyclaceae bacterium UTPRO2]